VAAAVAAGELKTRPTVNFAAAQKDAKKTSPPTPSRRKSAKARAATVDKVVAALEEDPASPRIFMAKGGGRSRFCTQDIKPIVKLTKGTGALQEPTAAGAATAGAAAGPGVGNGKAAAGSRLSPKSVAKVPRGGAAATPPGVNPAAVSEGAEKAAAAASVSLDSSTADAAAASAVREAKVAAVRAWSLTFWEEGRLLEAQFCKYLHDAERFECKLADAADSLHDAAAALARSPGDPGASAALTREQAAVARLVAAEPPPALVTGFIDSGSANLLVGAYELKIRLEHVGERVELLLQTAQSLGVLGDG